MPTVSCQVPWHMITLRWVSKSTLYGQDSGVLNILKHKGTLDLAYIRNCCQLIGGKIIVSFKVRYNHFQHKIKYATRKVALDDFFNTPYPLFKLCYIFGILNIQGDCAENQ